MKNKAIIFYNHIIEYADAGEDEKDVYQMVELVNKALIELGYTVKTAPLSFNTETAIELIKKEKPAFIFNLVEGIDNYSESVTISTMIFDILNVPYTGSGLDAMYLTSNKLITKKFLSFYNLLTPKWFEVSDINKIKKTERYIIKHKWHDGSLGLDEHCVFTYKEIDRIKTMLKNDKADNYFIEQFVEGREFNISLLGGKAKPQVLPPAEILFNNFPKDKPKMVGYKAKWQSDSFEFNNTTRSFDFQVQDKPLLNQLKKLSIECWKRFNLKGYVRIDFRVNEKNNPLILEINCNPCISEDAGFVAACARTGIDYKEMVKRIINDIYL